MFVIKNIDVDEATAEAGWWWKIIPVNGKEENVVGVSVNGDDALEGTLDDKAPQAGALKEGHIHLHRSVQTEYLRSSPSRWQYLRGNM